MIWFCGTWPKTPPIVPGMCYTVVLWKQWMDNLVWVWSAAEAVWVQFLEFQLTAGEGRIEVGHRLRCVVKASSFGEALKPQKAIGIWCLHCCHGLNRSHVLNANYRFVSHSSPHSHLKKKKIKNHLITQEEHFTEPFRNVHTIIFRMNVL